MTNALTLVPAFRRQINVYAQGANTNDSALAGYIADAIQGLESMWDRTYTIEFISPSTYIITPDVVSKDIRPIILLASIIYKMGNINTTSFVDGDFSWNSRGSLAQDLTKTDRAELLTYVPVRLAQAVAGQFLGYKSIYNPENFDWWGTLKYVWPGYY